MKSGVALLPQGRHCPRVQIHAQQTLTQHILLLPLELPTSQSHELPSTRNEARTNEGGGEAVVLGFDQGDGDVVLGERVGVEPAFLEAGELGGLRGGTAVECEGPGGAEVVGEGEVVENIPTLILNLIILRERRSSLKDLKSPRHSIRIDITHNRHLLQRISLTL
ncbi:hypothetical protein BCR35DRAFT_298107 [Leucosporidium creatinivorum]|uniref:Uncharacterized protein n=1 Tax=Leucosporidium creatinivorum TaxID=106004 RepID=A0A1Y2G3X2_9BASI|nr:hypothetical protein BCR35DRAFT_298107 [Leucosporidium creatinivorum]